MPPSSCPSCSSGEIEREDVNGHSQAVCTSCGFICDEVSFSNEDSGYCPPSGPISTAIKSHLKVSDDKKYSVSRRLWVSETKKICKVQGLPENMTKEIVALFERAYHHSKFVAKHDKQILSGACLYVVCRQNLWPLLVKDIASTVQCSPYQVWSTVKLLVKEFHLDVPPPIIEHHIPSILNRVGLTDQGLQKKAEDLFNLANETWLASGRRAEQVILAAGCLAWSSQQTKKQTIRSFKNIVKGNAVCSVGFYKRLAELSDVVVTLAKEIPWISKKHLKRESAQYLINDVLQNKKTLLAKFKTKNDNDGLDSANMDNKKYFLPPAAMKRTNSTAQDEPSCSFQHDLTSETLCDLDIPESDMHKFIYNPEEVEEREQILKEFRDFDDGDDHEDSSSEENDQEDTVNEVDENGGNDIFENNDKNENVICEDKGFPPPPMTNNGLYNEDRAEKENQNDTTDEDKAEKENKSDSTDGDVQKDKFIGSPNLLKRKAPLLPHSSSDESPSKRSSRRFNRSSHMKISKQNITRLTKNRHQKAT